MIAFLIEAHGDPAHLARLVRRLAPHRVFVHLDAKTPLTAAWRAIDATFVEPRVPVYWSGYSQVEATLVMIRAALASGEDYTKLVLLSGACYPLRPVAELAAMFARDGGHNYITWVAMRDSPHLMTLIERRHRQDGLLPVAWTTRWRAAWYAEKLLRKGLRTAARSRRRRWPLAIEPCHGSTWWALTPECAAYVVDRIDADPALAATYRRTFCPDEHIFASIINASRFAARSTGRIAFAGRGVYRTANLHVIHPSLSKWYALDDLDALLASGRFFVRKVRSGLSDTLLDALDAQAGVESTSAGDAAMRRPFPSTARP